MHTSSHLARQRPRVEKEQGARTSTLYTRRTSYTPSIRDNQPIHDYNKTLHAALRKPENDAWAQGVWNSLDIVPEGACGFIPRNSKRPMRRNQLGAKASLEAVQLRSNCEDFVLNHFLESSLYRPEPASQIFAAAPLNR
jgi:hypothetical protein